MNFNKRVPTISCFFFIIIFYSTVSLSAQEIRTHRFGNATEALVISIDGPFEEGLAERFRNFLDSDGFEGFNVSLNSVGGNLMEGIRLGYLLRELEYVVSIGKVIYVTNPFMPNSEQPEGASGQCLSACAIAFLGGVERSPGNVSKLGFHQFYRKMNLWDSNNLSQLHAETLGEAQIISGMIVSYMVDMGVDARLFAKSSSAGPNELFFLTEEEALEFQVVTSRAFKPFQIEPYKDGIVAASKRAIPTQPYDYATQTTIYCREGLLGKATLMMTAEGNGVYEENPKGRLIITDQQTRETEFEIPSSKVKLRVQKNVMWIELEIGLPIIRKLLNAGKLYADLLVSRASGRYFVNHYLNELDRKMIRSALMHCI
jgi:hypothetical protein